jgi:hypothetical protein
MTTEKLAFYKVQLHRLGGKTKGCVTVQARSEQHAGRVAVEQTIEVSFPKSKKADWVVDSVLVVAEVGEVASV